MSIQINKRVVLLLAIFACYYAPLLAVKPEQPYYSPMGKVIHNIHHVCDQPMFTAFKTACEVGVAGFYWYKRANGNNQRDKFSSKSAAKGFFLSAIPLVLYNLLDSNIKPLSPITRENRASAKVEFAARSISFLGLFGLKMWTIYSHIRVAENFISDQSADEADDEDNNVKKEIQKKEEKEENNIEEKKTTKDPIKGLKNMVKEKKQKIVELQKKISKNIEKQEDNQKLIDERDSELDDPKILIKKLVYPWIFSFFLPLNLCTISHELGHGVVSKIITGKPFKITFGSKSSSPLFSKTIFGNKFKCYSLLFRSGHCKPGEVSSRVGQVLTCAAGPLMGVMAALLYGKTAELGNFMDFALGYLVTNMIYINLESLLNPYTASDAYQLFHALGINP